MVRRKLAGYAASFQSLKSAFSDLAQAELAALGDDLSRSGRRLAGALLLLVSALFCLFWALGLLVYLGVEVAGLWLPRWAAVAVVLGLVLLIVAALAWIGWRRLQRLEAPTVLVQRRWKSHRDWWLEQFPQPPPAGRSGSAGRADTPGESGPAADA